MFQIKANRWIAAALVATTSLLSFAPMAQADRGNGRGNGRRYKDERQVYHQAPQQRVYVRHSSGAGPALAGLVGGFILGTAVSQRSDCNYRRAPVRSYRYYDPSCDQSYDSMDECRMHFREHRRSPRVIRVIEVSSGECVRTMRYEDGNWRDYDDQNQNWDEDDGYYR